MSELFAENLFSGQPAFPDKLFYKIGEVSKIVELEPYVLRYWETEFSFLRPRKNKTGQRAYVKKDITTILQIKKLLHEERYTIEGVRKKIGDAELSRHTQKVNFQLSGNETLDKIKERLRNILSQMQ